MKFTQKLNLQAVAILSTVAVGATTLASNSQVAFADEVVTVNFQKGIKTDNGEITVLTQLNPSKIHQISSTSIKEKKEKINYSELSLDELKEKHSEISNKLMESETKVSITEEQKTIATIKQTVAENKLEQSKEKVEETTEKVKQIQSEGTESQPIFVGNPIEASKPSEEFSKLRAEKMNYSESEKEVVLVKNEKETLEIKKEEVQSEIQEISKEKSEIEQIIKIKEEEKRKEEEEARKRAEEEKKRAEEEAKRIAREKEDFNANAIAVAPYSYGEWVSNTSKIKDSDFEAPSLQATQTGYSGNGYVLGQCTWYVYNRVAQTGKYIDPYLGNGGDWNDSAPGKGFTVTYTPVSGSAVVFEGDLSNGYGHVGFVEHVYPDGSFLISEMNIGSPYTMAWRILTPGPGLSFVIPK